MKKLVTVVSLLACMASVGCMSLSEYVTPAQRNDVAVAYVQNAGLADANDFAGYFNLVKADRLAWLVDDAHEANQLQLAQLVDKDSLLYAQISDTVRVNVTQARESEQALFGEKGIVTLGLGMAGFGAIGSLLIKRPGDMTPQEVKKAVTGSEEALTAKELEIAELVKGVQKFMNSGKISVGSLKHHLDAAQSASTKRTVAQIKANL